MNPILALGQIIVSIALIAVSWLLFDLLGSVAGAESGAAESSSRVVASTNVSMIDCVSADLRRPWRRRSPLR